MTPSETTSAAVTADTAPDAAPDAGAAAIEGRLDAVANGRVYGWAWDRRHPDRALRIEIRLAGPSADDRPLATATADLERADLAANGIGTGRHAFEALVDLPPGTDPSSVVAVARAPDGPQGGSEVLVLRLPSEGERLVEQAVFPHVARLGGAVEAARRDQQQVMALQQGLLRAVREIQKQLPPDPAPVLDELRATAERTAGRLDALTAGLERLDERVGALEVFLMRIDGTLRDLDTLVKDKRPGPGGGSPRMALAAGAGIVLAAAGGLLFALFGN